MRPSILVPATLDKNVFYFRAHGQAGGHLDAWGWVGVVAFEEAPARPGRDPARLRADQTA